jgi:hypothetical protein
LAQINHIVTEIAARPPQSEYGSSAKHRRMEANTDMKSMGCEITVGIRRCRAKDEQALSQRFAAGRLPPQDHAQEFLLPDPSTKAIRCPYVRDNHMRPGSSLLPSMTHFESALHDNFRLKADRRALHIFTAAFERTS